MSIRLLADENISWRLKRYLSEWDVLPANEINHHSILSDRFIWDFAKQHNYCILTFDEDFIDLLNFYSYPPKVIWLRTGNINTQTIASCLLMLHEQIEAFLKDEDHGVYQIYF